MELVTTLQLKEIFDEPKQQTGSMGFQIINVVNKPLTL